MLSVIANEGEAIQREVNRLDCFALLAKTALVEVNSRENLKASQVAFARGHKIRGCKKPERRRDLKKLALLILFGFAGISLLALLSGRGLVAPWSFIKGISQAKGQYFRFIGEFTYKGEPVVLDSVSACGGRLTVYKDNSHSEDIFAGPQLYGVKLPDGKALVAKAAFCGDHWRHDSGMPPDFTPVTILFDDAETLASGYAYVSNEAYERPNSDLKLIRARLMPVTPDEAVALLKVQKPNVVRSLNIQSPSTVRDFKKLYPGKRPSIAMFCEGFFKLPVPTDVVDEVRKRWPQDHPRYWVPWDDKEYFELTQIVKNSHLYGGPTVRDGIEVPGRSWAEYMALGTRTDGGSIYDNWDKGKGFENNPRRRNLYIAPPYYPLVRVDGADSAKLVEEFAQGDFHFFLQNQEDAMRGLLHCYGVANGMSRRSPDDKSLCDIKFGSSKDVLNLPPHIVGRDPGPGESVGVPFVNECLYSFNGRNLIYEGDQSVWFHVFQNVGSDLGEQQDVN